MKGEQPRCIPGAFDGFLATAIGRLDRGPAFRFGIFRRELNGIVRIDGKDPGAAVAAADGLKLQMRKMGATQTQSIAATITVRRFQFLAGRRSQQRAKVLVGNIEVDATIGRHGFGPVGVGQVQEDPAGGGQMFCGQFLHRRPSPELTRTTAGSPTIIG